MINLTEKAQEQLAGVLQSNPQYKFVRVGVRGGGCSGFEYSIGLIEECDPEWEKFEYPKVTVVVDQMSMMYLDGVNVDYVESLTESGFKFTNPNVRSQCGCGKSFSV